MRRIKEKTVDEALGLVLSAKVRKPAGAMPRRLDQLFRDLARDKPNRDPDETVEMIWALWIAHVDHRASAAMIAAVEAISAGARDLARPILDRLIEDYPDWSEAWNKRATLSFLEKRDQESLRDIVQTLMLEPRHFGAMLGFGQICLRHGRPAEAKAAFEMALAVNPHLDGLIDIVSDLAAAPQRFN